MRLVLCDQNRILCEALAVALQPHGHTVLAITTTAADGVTAVAVHRPDVCLLDLRFPGPGDGLAAARAMQQHSHTKVLVLSAVTDPAISIQALEAGVAGFVRKDQTIDQIADALDVVAAGGLVLDTNVSHPAHPRAATPPREHPPYELTPREEEVLHRIVDGQGTTQMACEMKIATSTLRTYVKSVLIKLGAHTRLQAAALASREGVLRDLARPGSAREGIPHLT